MRVNHLSNVTDCIAGLMLYADWASTPLQLVNILW